MLLCVLDDSGSNKEGPAFVLAGYLASVNVWEAFSKRWQGLLDKPRILQYFKMREANSLRGQFWGWSPGQRDQRVMEFVEVISKSGILGGVASTVFWEDFNRISSEFRDVPFHPYDLLLHGSIAHVVHFCQREGIQGPINFVFDEQEGWGNRALQAFDVVVSMLTDHERELIGGRPVHRDDRSFLPLQAADLIAWQIRRLCEDNKHLDPEAPADQLVMNSSALRTLDRVGTLCNTYGIDRLRDMAVDFRAARRLLGTNPDPKTLREWSRSPFERR